MISNKINLADKFETFSDTWHPRIVGELNGQHVKLVKVSGEFVWHHHDHEDEMFYVVRPAGLRLAPAPGQASGR